MPVTIISILYRLDGAAQVADMTFQLTGKPEAAGPGGSNRFTVYGIPAAAAVGLVPGSQRTLALLP